MMRMSKIERVTFTLPTKLAAIVKEAVESGNYASSSEVIREALRVSKTQINARLPSFGKWLPKE